MTKTQYLFDEYVPDFDPFHTPWVLKIWHPRIVQVAAPATSRVYGTEITGGPCCVWQGARNHLDPEKGYGLVRVDGRLYLLHRYAFMCHHDVELFSSDHVDHLCRRRLCFNPYHHENTTPLENYERGDGPLYRFKSKRARLAADMKDLPF